MSEPLSSGAGAGTTICQHCGSDRFSQDAIAAQQRIQELEAEVRELTAKALETGIYHFHLSTNRMKTRLIHEQRER